MKKFVVLIAALCFGFVLPVNHDVSSLHGYDLAHPDLRFVLPDTLREISGITAIDEDSFACIQDENGLLFFYDAVKNEIRSQLSFAGNGDYEAIARVGKTIYVLRSDGMLYEINGWENKKIKTKEYFTAIPASNNEGLCYDAANHRLLIGCKSKPGKGPAFKDIRAIYAFDLVTKKTSRAAVCKFSVEEIIRFAIDNSVELPVRGKGKSAVPFIKFSTSEIGIHPITGQLYLLSAADHMLFIFSANGLIEHVEKLDPGLFNKPEGVTFFENGDMLITNEAQNRKPTLLRFNFKN